MGTESKDLLPCSSCFVKVIKAKEWSKLLKIFSVLLLTDKLKENFTEDFQCLSPGCLFLPQFKTKTSTPIAFHFSPSGIVKKKSILVSRKQGNICLLSLHQQKLSRYHH